MFWVFFLEVFQTFKELHWTPLCQFWRFVSFTADTLNWKLERGDNRVGTAGVAFAPFRGRFSWPSVTKSHHQPKFNYLFGENSPPYFHFTSIQEPSSENSEWRERPWGPDDVGGANVFRVVQSLRDKGWRPGAPLISYTCLPGSARPTGVEAWGKVHSGMRQPLGEDGCHAGVLTNTSSRATTK